MPIKLIIIKKLTTVEDITLTNIKWPEDWARKRLHNIEKICSYKFNMCN